MLEARTLENFRKGLEKKLRMLQKERLNLGGDEEAVRHADQIDAAQMIMQKHLAATFASNAGAELRLVSAALAKIVEAPEKFGVCEEEDCPNQRIIPLKRLLAVPEAQYCFFCQNARESALSEPEPDEALFDEA